MKSEGEAEESNVYLREIHHPEAEVTSVFGAKSKY